MQNVRGFPQDTHHETMFAGFMCYLVTVNNKRHDYDKVTRYGHAQRANFILFLGYPSLKRRKLHL
jgi:hypothetical protein